MAGDYPPFIIHPVRHRLGDARFYVIVAVDPSGICICEVSVFPELVSSSCSFSFSFSFSFSRSSSEAFNRYRRSPHSQSNDLP